jgi:hypothetical protein
MKAWTVIRGNTSQQEIPIKDKKGVLVDDLADATEIKFQVKEEKKESGSPLISKDLVDGIEVDQPSEGYLRITLAPSDSAGIRPSERYVMALQIKWLDVESYETKLRINGELTDKFIVKAGIIS